MLDSLQPRQNHASPRGPDRAPKPKHWFRFWFVFILLLLLAGGIFAGSRLVLYAQRILEGNGNVFSFRQLFLASDKKLLGEDQGEVYILLMGIGGEGHDGPNLTDTMILATIKVPQNPGDKTQVGLFSIPRDLVMDIQENNNYLKINSAYAYGEMKGPGQGGALAMRTVGRLLGIEIPYYATLDFKGFQEVIDDLGGVDVTVDRTFTDREFPRDFPIDTKGYLPPITFQAGLQHLNGTQALEFVRSRHGDNNEGTDFARSRRQQKILKAVKDKATSLNVLLNVGQMDQILSDLSDHIRTNLQVYEIRRLYDLIKGIQDSDIATHALDVQSGILCNQIAQDTGAYILVPCAGLIDYSAIRNFFNNQFQDQSLQGEQATVEIQNASGNAQLLKLVQDRLTYPNLQVTSRMFRGGATFNTSILYDNTHGQKPQTLSFLKQRLGIPLADGPYPFATTNNNADLVIVITSDIKDKLP